MRRLAFIGIVVITTLNHTTVIGQSVGIGTTNPHPSAKLEVFSTGRGILIPRLTATQRDSISTPAHGLLIFNIDSFTLEMYDSVQGHWVVVADTIGCVPPCTTPVSGTQPPEGIIIGNKSLHHSASLELFVKNKGILIPMLTYSQKNLITNPAPYLIIGRYDTLQVEIYDGSQWVRLLSPKRCASPCTSPPSGITPNPLGIGIGISTPHHSAILHINDSSKGILIPRLTIAQRQAIPSPAHGLIILETDSFCLEVYDSVKGLWMLLSCPNCPIPDCNLSISLPTWKCVGNIVAITATGCDRTNKFEWTYPSGWTYVSGQFTDTLKLIVGNTSGDIQVRECIWCGCSEYVSTTVAPDSSPYNLSITQSPSGNICPIDTVVLRASGNGNVTSWQWTVPSGWTVIGGTNMDSVKAVPPGPGVSGTFQVKACNPCGCDSITTTVSVQNVVLTPSITGPTKVCAGDQLTWRINPGGGTSWTWSYPPSWTLVVQGGDSIVLVPDTVDGYLIVQVTDGCGLGIDSLLVIADSCYAFCEIVQGPDVDIAWGAVETPSGDIVIIGEYGSGSGGNNQDIWIAKLSKNGNTLMMTRKYGTSAQEYGYALTQTPDGGYLIGGNLSHADGVVIKLDASLNTQWITRVGWFVSNESEYIWGLATTTSGKIVYGGYRYGNSTGGWDRGIIGMLDANGNFLWGKTISGGTLIQLYNVATYGNRIYVVGLVRNGPLGNQDGLLLAFDTLGNFLWGRALGSSTDDNSIGLDILPDGSVVVEATAYGISGGDAIVYRIDSNGNMLWARRITVGGNFDFAEDVVYTHDGGIAVVGGTESAGAGLRDVWVFKLDTAGNFLWGKAIGGSSYEWGHRISRFTGDYITVVGMARSYGNGSANFYIIKMKPDGTLPCTSGCNIVNAGSASNWSSIANYTPSISNFGSSQSTTLPSSTGGTLIKICP